MSVFESNLADFFSGHLDDPLRPPEEFVAWREAAPDFHALFERTLCEAADTRTTIATNDGARPVINMASLDYLGICRRREVVDRQREVLESWGSGACGVPLLSGMTVHHRALQDRVNDVTGRGGTILFSSGYAGAIGVCSALLRRGDVALLDRHAHMSWMDGVRMSGAKLVTFDHNDACALKRGLTTHEGRRRVVIVDGLYSMDGDLADLPTLLDVCESHGVGMIVDEAHSMFAMGPRGGGATAHFGEQRRVRLVFGTFSKALSVVGGFASGEAALIDYIRYYSHPYVFSAALPPAIAAGIERAVEISTNDESLRERLSMNAAKFRGELQRRGFDTGASETHVVPVIVGSDRELLYRGTKMLMERGLFVAPVDYPAVAEDAVRLRCAVSAGHTIEELDVAVSLIEEVFAGANRR